MPAKPATIGPKKRHCYICKQVEGSAEKRKGVKDTDPIVQLYPSTPRCKPCQREFAKRAYWKKKKALNEQRARAREALGMPKMEGSGSADATAASDA